MISLKKISSLIGLFMKIALFALAFVLPTAAFGMVFNWIDSTGIAHFTNKEYEIPTRYRTRVRQLYPEQADTPAPQQSLQTRQPVKPENQTPHQQLSPETPSRMQQPSIMSVQPKQDVRPSHGRKRRGAASSSSEE